EQFFAEAKQRCPPHPSLYNAMMGCYRRCKQPAKVEALFRELQAHPLCKPNALSYTEVMQVRLERGNLAELKAFLKEMKAAKQPLDAVHYAQLIQTACSQGDLQLALQLLAEMRAPPLALEPGRTVINAVIRLATVQRQPEVA